MSLTKGTMTPEHKAKVMQNLAKAQANQAIKRANYSVGLEQIPESLRQIEKPDSISVNVNQFHRTVARRRLTNYLNSRHFEQDWKRARLSDPKWAIEFSTDRIWGKPGAGISPTGSGQAGTTVAVLVKVLTGDQHTQPVVFDTKALTFTDRTVEESKGETGQNDETGKAIPLLGLPVPREAPSDGT